MVQADALKVLGLDELGYVFLTIDDNWSLPERHNVTGIVMENIDFDKFLILSTCLFDKLHING